MLIYQFKEKKAGELIIEVYYPEKDDANFKAPLVISKNGEEISSYKYKVWDQN